MANKVEVILDGNNKSLLSAFSGAVNSAKNSASGISSAFSSAFNNLPGLASLTAAGVAAGLGAMLKSAIDTADGLDEMSQRTGVSVEALSTLSYAAEMGAIDINTLEQSMAKLTRSISGATEKGDESASVFNKLGIELKNQDGSFRATDSILLDLADKFQAMPDGIGKTATAIKIFGKSGAEMVPFLNQGKAGIQDLQAQARSLGLEISSNTATAAGNFNDNLTILNASMRGIALTAMSNLMPSLLQTSTALTDFATKSDAAYLLGQGLAVVLKAAASAAMVLGAAIMVPAYALGSLGAAIATGFSRGWDEALKTFDYGGQQMKNMVDGLGDALKEMWGNSGEAANKYNDLLKQLKQGEAADIETAKAKKLEEQWKSVQQTLQNDVAKNAMSEVAYKFYEINQKFDDLVNKFGNKKIIEQWKESMIFAAGEFEKVQEKAAYKVPQTPPELMKPVPLDTAYYDAQIKEATRVTTAELALMALRHEATSDMFSNMAGAADNFYQMSGQKSKLAFDIFKAFAIAQTTIKTYEGAMSAYSSLAGIPIIGPALGAAAAAAVIAMGVSQIGKITSTGPGGGVSGGSVPPAPRIPTDRSQNGSTGTSGGKSLTINLYGDYMDRDKLVRDLVPAIEKAYGDGA